jgi:hypothetical protein
LNNAGHDVTRNDELKTFVFDRHCPANRSISSVRYNVPVPAYPPGVASALRSPPRRGDYHGTIEISFKTGRFLQKLTKPSVEIGFVGLLKISQLNLKFFKK